jgi:anti-sigma regulatory factor (Ser/Thr protein kinase)
MAGAPTFPQSHTGATTRSVIRVIVGVGAMKTGAVKGKMETTVDHTACHTAATVTATRCSTPGLVAVRAVCSDTSRGRRQRADSFRRWFAARPSSAAVMREALTTYLTANDIDGAVTRLIVLCADEALINAVAHAAGSPLGVFADLRDDHFTLEVSDGGPGFDPSQIDGDAEPDLMGEHGRGLFLIRNLMDDLEILSDENGTTLHMERDLPAVRL